MTVSPAAANPIRSCTDPVVQQLCDAGQDKIALKAQTLGEMEVELGSRLKTLRVHRNLDQATLSARAGISVRALRNLESGSGSSLRTLIQVIRALGREQWLGTIAPVPTINPLADADQGGQTTPAREQAKTQDVGLSQL
ncbi:helix-turn-helix domain-containing protein [Noviherbaspirillum cavernae]|uniref:helix-turn-helix domain-containing protein n=1 Tax=Noviherbaspirillum cavernae TaxID=2320862 RepID=UPI0018F7B413|nr:helix-turn-helix transcriptional regulator [Noviherbaspirillum cavernae]